VTRVQAQDNNINGYLVLLFQMVLDQLTSVILQVVLMRIANVQEIIFIDKSNKWFHDRRLFQVVSHLHVVSIMQDDGFTSDPQL
jgi:hypothetical protein